jgi:hypothetical protein
MTGTQEKIMAAITRATREGRAAWVQRQSKLACPYPPIKDGTRCEGGLLRTCWMHGWDHAARDLMAEEAHAEAKAFGKNAEARYLARQSLGDLWEALCQLPYGWSTARMRLAIAHVRVRMAYRTWRWGVGPDLG